MNVNPQKKNIQQKNHLISDQCSYITVFFTFIIVHFFIKPLVQTYIGSTTDYFVHFQFTMSLTDNTMLAPTKFKISMQFVITYEGLFLEGMY